jgi:hypothetical protein
MFPAVIILTTQLSRIIHKLEKKTPLNMGAGESNHDHSLFPLIFILIFSKTPVIKCLPL